MQHPTPLITTRTSRYQEQNDDLRTAELYERLVDLAIGIVVVLVFVAVVALWLTFSRKG
jgi:hypothetical protein